MPEYPLLRIPTGVASRPSQHDLRLLYGTRTARAFGAGSLSVALALDLATAYGPLLSGLFLGVSLAAAAGWSIAAGRIEPRIGRRRTFCVAVFGFATGGILLFLALRSSAAVLLALSLGGILASSSDIGPLPALEQAALASVVSDRDRTRVFGRYNVMGYLGAAGGSLVAAPMMGVGAGFLPAEYDLVLLVYGLLGIALVPAYLALSTRADRSPQPVPRTALSPASRSSVFLLSGLFSVDAFGGGLVANFLITLWLRARFDAAGETIGLLLAAAMVGAAVSLLLAEPLARRFGLVNTMVFTHLPSSVLLLVFAFAPTLPIAGVLWVARSLLSQVDVPTRQSFIQAIVTPDERTAAAGYTTAARSTAAIGGPVTGALLSLGGPWVAAPFALAGSTKIAYDLGLYARFRTAYVPEEAPGPPSGAKG